MVTLVLCVKMVGGKAIVFPEGPTVNSVLPLRAKVGVILVTAVPVVRTPLLGVYTGAGIFTLNVFVPTDVIVPIPAVCVIKV